jgi:hypothetical protein
MNTNPNVTSMQKVFLLFSRFLVVRCVHTYICLCLCIYLYTYVYTQFIQSQKNVTKNQSPKKSKIKSQNQSQHFSVWVGVISHIPVLYIEKDWNCYIPLIKYSFQCKQSLYLFQFQLSISTQI